MAESNDPNELINQLISFIKRERTLFGDFAVEIQSSPKSDKKLRKEKEPSLQGDIVTGHSRKQTTSSASTTSTVSPSSTPKEGLSNRDESNEVYSQIDKCNTLKELEALCRKADVLKTDLEDTQLVFGVGNPDADLMLVGEAPGAEEDKQGEPFVGKAGQLLNQILDAIGFKREDVYIANILKHRPPNNRNPKPEERKRSLPFLQKQIELVDPKLILALGKISAQTLLDKNTSLSRMRGKFHKFHDKYELLATYHPAALLRHPKWKRPTWEDVQLLRKRYDDLGGKP